MRHPSSLLHMTYVSANELKHDFAKIDNQAFQWKINFNPGPNRQTPEVVFSQNK